MNKAADDILKKHLILKLEANKTSDDDRVDAIHNAMEEYAQNRGNLVERQNEVLRNQKDALDKLQEFKAYVHQRLDDAGIQKDPESPHREKGCRIGGRLDIVLGIVKKYDGLSSMVASYYPEDDADVEGDLGTIGEKVCMHFGYL